MRISDWISDLCSSDLFCYKVRAEKEVILCGGVINSPLLLQLSGIGARDVLEPLGIRNLCDSPAVGRNLQHHLGVDYLIQCNSKTLNDELCTWNSDESRVGNECVGRAATGGCRSYKKKKQ